MGHLRINGPIGTAGSRRSRQSTDADSAVYLAASPPHVFHILDRLKGQSEGVGSGSLQLHLRELGFSMSQPTVGRVLWELDHDGLTRRVSNRGRVLTEAGMRHLELMRKEQQRRAQLDQLLEATRLSGMGESLELLAAIRFIEGQLAGLAAKCATDDQIDEMRRLLTEQHEQLKHPLRGAQQGTDFHSLVFKAARNRFLEATVIALWNSSQEAILKAWYEANLVIGKSSYPDHMRILRAIEKHRPAAAQQAMHAHFDSFIHAVEKKLAADPKALTASKHRTRRSAPTPAPTSGHGASRRPM
jgi:GntR family L-lactate dehydrogenase operon transcriptional regulator